MIGKSFILAAIAGGTIAVGIATNRDLRAHQHQPVFHETVTPLLKTGLVGAQDKE